jgi:hypothetical protein
MTKAFSPSLNSAAETAEAEKERRRRKTYSSEIAALSLPLCFVSQNHKNLHSQRTYETMGLTAEQKNCACLFVHARCEEVGSTLI